MTTANNSRQLLTITEICELYNVHRTLIYRRITDGTLPAYRLGRNSYRIDPESARKAFEVNPANLRPQL